MTPPAEHDPELADPTVLARFGRLELLARLAVEGMLAGLHRSPFKGSSVEFAEHRQYGPGDEIRHIDWRAYGKSDRFFIKEYEEETNLKAYLAFDSTASMGYAGAHPSKLEYGRQLAATLAHLMIRQRDAVGLACFDRLAHELVPPRSTPGHFSTLCQALERAEPDGETPPSAVLNRLAERIDRRGLIVLLSDAFEPLDDLVGALRHLRHRRHEVLILHILAPEEETFPFDRPSRFRSLERPDDLRRIDARARRDAYLERFGAFCRDLQAEAHALGVDYHRASTADPPARTLLDYLSLRASRRGRGRHHAPGGAR